MAFIGSFTVHNISLWTFQPVILNTPANLPAEQTDGLFISRNRAQSLKSLQNEVFSLNARNIGICHHFAEKRR